MVGGVKQFMVCPSEVVMLSRQPNSTASSPLAASESHNQLPLTRTQRSQSMKITFPNADGVQLAARLERPLAQPIRAYALFAHCFTCSKNLNAAVNISRALTQAGIAVLRFDFTGLGESEGDFADTNFSSNVGDLVAAAKYLEDEFDAPQLLVGHSLGGAAVLQAASQLPSVRAVATVAAPADPDHVRKLFTGKEDVIEEQGIAEVSLAGRAFTIKKAVFG